MAIQSDAAKATVEQLRALVMEMERLAGQARVLLTCLDGQTVVVDPVARERTRPAVMAIRAGVRAKPVTKQQIG